MISYTHRWNILSSLNSSSDALKVQSYTPTNARDPDFRAKITLSQTLSNILDLGNWFHITDNWWCTNRDEFKTSQSYSTSKRMNESEKIWLSPTIEQTEHDRNREWLSSRSRAITLFNHHKCYFTSKKFDPHNLDFPSQLTLTTSGSCSEATNLLAKPWQT